MHTILDDIELTASYLDTQTYTDLLDEITNATFHLRNQAVADELAHYQERDAMDQRNAEMTELAFTIVEYE